VEPGQGHELESVAHLAQLALELGDIGLVQVALPVNDSKQQVALPPNGLYGMIS
jgi:hypothetical protein